MLGIGKLEARLDAQEQATAQHRAWEGDALRALKDETAEVKQLAVVTNGQVKAHTIELALIKRDEERAAEIEAARLKAAEVASASKRSWWQTALMVGGGAAGGTASLVVGYLLLHLAEHGTL